MIYLGIDGESFISTKEDCKRPPGCLSGGSQGDHTTPFTTLQNQIVNAIEGVPLDDAWDNIADTYKVYTTLPGWSESKKFVTKTHAEYMEGLLKTKGDVDALQVAVTELLTIRNKIELTSLPNGGHGNGEGKWAGSLQYQERQFQLGHSPVLKKTEVLDYIWAAFEHGRVSKLGSDKAGKILTQHAMTMGDSYPMLNKSVGIDPSAITDHYKTQNWLKYTPA